MRFLAKLPPDREAEGVFHVATDEGKPLAGPFRCRGEADNTGAKAHQNVQEDPTLAFGDHPYGVYRVVDLVADPKPAHTYGPYFIHLSPVSGEALEAWRDGRRGIGLHGGDPGPGDTLRATYGCNRLTNEGITELAKLWL